MKPINEKEFERPDASVFKKNTGVSAGAKRCLAALKSFIRIRDDRDPLTARLRRDAGIDELGIELRRFAKAPLIR